MFFFSVIGTKKKKSLPLYIPTKKKTNKITTSDIETRIKKFFTGLKVKKTKRKRSTVKREKYRRIANSRETLVPKHQLLFFFALSLSLARAVTDERFFKMRKSVPYRTVPYEANASGRTVFRHLSGEGREREDAPPLGLETRNFSPLSESFRSFLAVRSTERGRRR